MIFKRKLTFCVDFDGTCVSHAFPEVGKDIGAVPVLKELVENGHKLILYTMRAPGMKPGDPDTEAAAVEWFKDNDIPLWGVNRNPVQWRWTKSRKVNADYYIDDAALGAPLKLDTNISPRPFIDWVKMRELLVAIGALN